MDAVKFLKTLSRMCNYKCRDCEIGNRSGCDSCASWQKTHPEEAVAIVEQWAAEHPVKTRQSVFLEQYPEARLSKDGVLLLICPRTISSAYRNEEGTCNIANHGTCADCKREFWLAEVEE